MDSVYPLPKNESTLDRVRWPEFALAPGNAWLTDSDKNPRIPPLATIIPLTRLYSGLKAIATRTIVLLSLSRYEDLRINALGSIQARNVLLL